MLGKLKPHGFSRWYISSFQGEANPFLPSLLPGNAGVRSTSRSWRENIPMPAFPPSGNFPVMKGLRIPPFSSTGMFLFFPATLPFPASPPIYYISNQAPKSLEEPEIGQIHGPCHPESCM